MKLNSQDLNKISLLTLEHYNRHAEEFWDGTRLHDVSQNVESLLQHIEGKPPYSTLAAGLGATSKRSPSEAIMRSAWKAPSISSPWREPIAGAKYGGKIFLSSHCPAKYFDGVFANAALFHIPRQELPRVLLELHATLKPGGVLFSSNPRGR